MIGRKFAANFTPIFRACDLGIFCTYPNEKAELLFLFKYKPFSKYRPVANIHTNQNIVAQICDSTVLTPAPRAEDLSPTHKEFIKKEWQTHFSSGALTFDDDLVIRKVNKSIQEEVSTVKSSPQISQLKKEKAENISNK